MSYKNNQSKKDSTHTGIVEYLEGVGWNVKDTSMCPNFCDTVISNGENWLCEIKGVRKSLSIDQIEFLATWSGKSVILTSENDAWCFTNMGEKFKYSIVTREQKQKILEKCWMAKFKSKAKNPEMQMSEFLRILEEKK